MSHYDEYLAYVVNKTDGEKLAFLRPESLRLLQQIMGYAALISNLVEDRAPAEMPDDFGRWCTLVVDSSYQLNDLIEAVTGGRLLRTLNKTKQVKALN